MIRVYGDLQFSVQDIKNLGERFVINFYTTAKSHAIRKTDADIVDGVIKLNKSELSNIGRGVLQYEVNNITEDADYDDGSYDSTYTATTNYFIISDIVIEEDDVILITKVTEDLRDLIEKDITSLTIPDGTTSIGDYIFWNCPNLTEVKIPDTVKSIGSYSFYRCSALKEVKIPETVTSIGSYSFYRCEALKEVKIPDTVATIGGQAFYDCWSISKVTIGSGVTSIQDWAFKHCFALNSITILATTPPTLGSSAFDDTNDCPIYVPAASVNSYKNASNWIEYADRIFGITE